MDYFEREIKACMSLDHPNVLKIIERGTTPAGKPYLITDYCSGGSLNSDLFVGKPAEGMRAFLRICEGVSHAHAKKPNPIYHLDLKPDNIFMDGDRPLVGDWGICFIEDNESTLTRCGMRGSRHYCAPELRDPRISGDPNLACSDVYSLGKVLYFLFTGDVYDGHEDDYSGTERLLAGRFPSDPQFAFIDDLICETVLRVPDKRLADATVLSIRARDVLHRIEAGGRVLDLRVPQRCLFCQAGHYRAAHDQIHAGSNIVGKKFPDYKTRLMERPFNPANPSPRSIYQNLIDVAAIVGIKGSCAPLILFCDYCGNMQVFHLDKANGGEGENWRP
jgi:serine/threonine protein kinase